MMKERPGRQRPKRRHPNADDRLIEAAQARLLRDCDFVDTCEDCLIEHGQLEDVMRGMLRRLANDQAA